MQDKCRNSAGFTLIELMIVIAVLGVMLGLAVPAMSAMMAGSKLASVGQSLFYSLSLGRSEAIKRGNRVVICKSADGLRCTRNGGWEQGWIVFHDRNNNAQAEDGEAVLLHEQALPAALRLKGNRPVENYVSYTALGHTSTVGGGFQAGTFTLCLFSEESSAGQVIVISHTGRARSRRVRQVSCV